MNNTEWEKRFDEKWSSWTWNKGDDSSRVFVKNYIRSLLIKERARKAHPRSRTLRWGVVNNGVLLNPTFKTEAEAAVFIATGLVPIDSARREKVKINALVVDLGKHYPPNYTNQESTHN